MAQPTIPGLPGPAARASLPRKPQQPPFSTRMFMLLDQSSMAVLVLLCLRHRVGAELQLRSMLRTSAVRSSTEGPPRTSTRQCCPGPIGWIPVTAPVAKTMPARTG